MATISKTSTGTFKAIIRKNQRVINTKTFKLKKDARTWAKVHRGRPNRLRLHSVLLAPAYSKAEFVLRQLHKAEVADREVHSVQYQRRCL